MKTLSLFCMFTHLLWSSLETHSSNILFFHQVGTSSHRTSIWPLAEKLADKGHNVTYIFPIKKKIGYHSKIEEITPSKMIPLQFVGEYDINFRLNQSNHEVVLNAFSLCFDLCKAFYESPEIQEWLQRPGLHYDLILLDSSMGECIYGVIHKLKAKHIVFVPVLIPQLFDDYGIVSESSSIPVTIIFLGLPPKPSEMNLFGRVINTVEPLLWKFGHIDFLNKVHSLLGEETLDIPDLPPLLDFERNTSLVMLNTPFVDDYPMSMSLPPMFVYYSGLWCSKDKLKQIKPLMDNLTEIFEQKGGDGVVYVSFGSSVVM